jgi:hypothetical protein
MAESVEQLKVRLIALIDAIEADKGFTWNESAWPLIQSLLNRLRVLLAEVI